MDIRSRGLKQLIASVDWTGGGCVQPLVWTHRDELFIRREMMIHWQQKLFPAARLRCLPRFRRCSDGQTPFVLSLEGGDTKRDDKDVLPRQKCLDALAALRHAKWFQVHSPTLRCAHSAGDGGPGRRARMPHSTYDILRFCLKCLSSIRHAKMRPV